MVFDPNKIDGFMIVLDTVGQKYMRQTGPMIPASWYITAEREAQLNMLGGTLPTPVDGYMLLDTGAAHISIDDAVARELKLKPMGKMTEVHGIGGKGSLDHYEARLLLPVVPLVAGTPASVPVKIGVPTEAWESVDIQKNHSMLGHATPDGKPIKVIGVLGRIFLQFTRFTYNGLTGSVEIYIDKSAMFAKRD